MSVFSIITVKLVYNVISRPGTKFPNLFFQTIHVHVYLLYSWKHYFMNEKRKTKAKSENQTNFTLLILCMNVSMTGNY